MKIRELVVVNEGLADIIAGKIGQWRSGTNNTSKYMSRLSGIEDRVSTDAFYRNLEKAITAATGAGVVTDAATAQTYITQYMNNLLRNYDVASTGINLSSVYSDFASEYATKIASGKTGGIAQMPSAQKLWQMVGAIRGLTPNKERRGEMTYDPPTNNIEKSNPLITTRAAYTYDKGRREWYKYALPAAGTTAVTGAPLDTIPENDVSFAALNKEAFRQHRT